MNSIKHRLPRLHDALAPVLEASRADRSGLSTYINSIGRRCDIVDQHRRVLAGVKWDNLGILGYGDGPSGVVVELQSGKLELEHVEAVMVNVWIAFDGLAAGVCNIGDTIGRLINHCHGIGLDDKRASLFAIRAQASDESSLRKILADGDRTNWLRELKHIRGECQHGRIEIVLMQDMAITGMNRWREPRVCWPDPSKVQGGGSLGPGDPRMVNMSDYVADVLERAEALYGQVIDALITDSSLQFVAL